MSDLISRSEFIAVLKQLEEHSLTGKMHISNAIYLLENQPTAYNIDKVVEELDKIKGHYGYFGSEEGEYVPYEEAIEIVKAGVKNE